MRFEVDTNEIYEDMFQFSIICHNLTTGLIDYFQQKNRETDYDSLEKAIDNITFNMKEYMNLFCEEILRERSESE